MGESPFENHGQRHQVQNALNHFGPLFGVGCQCAEADAALTRLANCPEFPTCSASPRLCTRQHGPHSKPNDADEAPSPPGLEDFDTDRLLLWACL